ncbi:MAG TPA: hypothetical protein VJO35_05970 [Terriglobales bacterium]|nr:hypothetical protein [Terriglobales bacterium]
MESCRERIGILRYRWLSSFVALTIGLPIPAVSKNSQGSWSGQVQCQLAVQAQGYSLQETQTWTVTGASPYQDNGMLVYPAKWTSQSQGATQRMLGPNMLAGQWTGNVQPMDDVLIIAVRPSDNRLVIRRWHLPLQAPGAISGAKQTTAAGGTPNQSALSLVAYQWPLPTIEDSPTNTSVAGTGTISIPGNLMPLHTPDSVTANCKWQFSKGGNPQATRVPARLQGQVTGNQTDRTISGVQGGTSSTSALPGPHVEVGQVTPVSAVTTTSPSTGIETPTSRSSSATLVLSPVDAKCNQVFSIPITGSGTHFAPGTTVDLGAGVQVLGVSVRNAELLTTQLFVTEKAMPGAHTLTVTTGDEVASLSKNFNVIQPCQPTETIGIRGGLTPASGVQGLQNMTVNIGSPGGNVGVDRFITNFVSGVSKADFGPGVTVTSLTITSPTSATAVINIAADASPGTRTITMNTANQSATASFAVIQGK